MSVSISDTKAPAAHTLPPHLVSKANRGEELQRIVKAATDELDALKAEWLAMWDGDAVREYVNAAGKVVATVTHGNPNRLDQRALKAAHPDIVTAFTVPMPWDSVRFKA